jgi:hypothetical protein
VKYRCRRSGFKARESARQRSKGRGAVMRMSFHLEPRRSARACWCRPTSALWRNIMRVGHDPGRAAADRPVCVNLSTTPLRSRAGGCRQPQQNRFGFAPSSPCCRTRAALSAATIERRRCGASRPLPSPERLIIRSFLEHGLVGPRRTRRCDCTSVWGMDFCQSHWLCGWVRQGMPVIDAMLRLGFGFVERAR